MGSFFYKHPMLYNIFLKIIHKNNLEKRYNLVAEKVGKGKKVFELACGSCLIHNYLDKTCEYTGWDLNEDFISHAKNRGLNVFLNDIFDFDNYIKNDVTLIIDVLHHVVPKHELIVREALKKCNKLIIVEPVFKKGLMDYLASIFQIDYDGINSVENFSKWYYNESDLRNFFLSNGATEIMKLGNDLIVTFENKKSNNFK